MSTLIKPPVIREGYKHDDQPDLDLRVPDTVTLHYPADARHKEATAIVQIDPGMKGLIWNMDYAEEKTQTTQRKRWTDLPPFVTIKSDADCCYIDANGNVVCYP